MADAKVPKQEALARIIDAFIMERGSMYEHAMRPHLRPLSERIEQQLPLFGYEIADMAPKVIAAAKTPS